MSDDFLADRGSSGELAREAKKIGVDVDDVVKIPWANDHLVLRNRQLRRGSERRDLRDPGR